MSAGDAPDFGERALLRWIRSRPAGSPGDAFLRVDTGIGTTPRS